MVTTPLPARVKVPVSVPLPVPTPVPELRSSPTPTARPRRVGGIDLGAKHPPVAGRRAHQQFPVLLLRFLAQAAIDLVAEPPQPLRLLLAGTTQWANEAGSASQEGLLSDRATS